MGVVSKTVKQHENSKRCFVVEKLDEMEENVGEGARGIQTGKRLVQSEIDASSFRVATMLLRDCELFPVLV